MPESKQPGAEKPATKGFTLPEVTKEGSSFFRATSFELFAVRLMAMASPLLRSQFDLPVTKTPLR